MFPKSIAANISRAPCPYKLTSTLKHVIDVGLEFSELFNKCAEGEGVEFF